VRILSNVGVRLGLGAASVAGAAILASLVSDALAIAACVAAYCGYVRLVEKRWPPAELALTRAAARELAGGFALGVVLFCATMLWIALVADARFAVEGGALALPRLLLLAAVAATVEELLFRGVLLRLLAGWLGRWWALAISAVVFGGLHLLNPHATVIGAVAIAVEAGILLGAAFLATGRLWLPLGLHAAWNFTEGAFGTAISGTDAPAGYFATHLTGSAVWTGGSFGPEASLAAVVLCLAAAAMFLRKLSTQ